jgi:hypothetical protein
MPVLAKHFISFTVLITIYYMNWCHQNCPNKLRLSKHTDMTIHWKVLQEHFLMVSFSEFLNTPTCLTLHVFLNIHQIAIVVDFNFFIIRSRLGNLYHHSFTLTRDCGWWYFCLKVDGTVGEDVVVLPGFYFQFKWWWFVA